MQRLVDRFTVLCTARNNEVLQKFVKKDVPERYHRIWKRFIPIALEAECLYIVKYIMNHHYCDLDPDDVLIQILHITPDITLVNLAIYHGARKNDFDAFIMACKTGEQHIIEYFMPVKNAYVAISQAFPYICTSGHLHIVKWILTKGCTYGGLREGLKRAIWGGYIEIVKYIVLNHTAAVNKILPEMVEYADDDEKHEIRDWLKSRGY